MSDVSVTDRIAATWRRDRTSLVAVASRILADPVEAEDVVQDAFARLAVQRVEEIDDLRAWLVVVVRRLALDRLGSAHRRLSVPKDPGDFAPTTADTGQPDPADRVTLDDEVRRALTVVLDRLTPGERAAFLLHDVFGIGFEQIADLVGRTPAACRQLASRARRSVRDREGSDSPRDVADPQLRQVVETFLAACANGDVEAVARTLTADVSGWATVAGRRVGATTGVGPVAQRLMHFLGPRSGWLLTPLPLSEGMAVVAAHRGEPVALIRLEFRDGRIRSLHAIVLPG